MKKGWNIFKVLSYFIQSSSFPFVKYQIFAEIFFRKLSKNPGFPLLILKLLANETSGSDTVLNVSIFLKNIVLLRSNKIDPKIENKLTHNLLDLSFSVPPKISQHFTDNFSDFISRNYNPYYLLLFLKKIISKLESKMEKKNDGEFFLPIFSFLFCLFFSISELKVGFPPEFSIYEEIELLLFKIGIVFFDIHPFFFGDFQLNFISNFCINLSRFQSQFIEKKPLFDLKKWMILFISLSYSPLKEKIFSRKKKIQLLDSVYDFINSLFRMYEENFTFFIPSFFWLALKLFLNEKVFSQSLLDFILNAVASSQSRILSKDQRSFMFFSALFFKLTKAEKTLNLSFFLETKLVSSEGKLGHLERHKAANKISKPLRVLRENFLIKTLIEQKKDESGFRLNMIQYSTFHFFSTTLKVSGDSLKGIRVTLFYPNLSEFFSYVLKNMGGISKNYDLITFLDFLTLFRYQLPIKNLMGVLFVFLEKSEIEPISNFHFLIWMERLVSLRGNDGFGVLMLDAEEHQKKVVSNFLFLSFKKKELLEKTSAFFKKLLLRAMGNNLVSKDFIRFFLSLEVKISDLLENKNQTELSILYSMELFTFLFGLDYKNKNENIQDVFRFSSFVISQEISQFLPYVFDILSSSIIHLKGETFQDFLKKLFLGLLNPHVWVIKNLQRPMLRFIAKLLEEKNFPINQQIFIFTMSLFQYLIPLIKDISLIFKTLGLILEKNSESETFIPHIIEIFSGFFNNPGNEIFGFWVINLFLDLLGKKRKSFSNRYQNPNRKIFLSLLMNFFLSNFKNSESFLFTNQSIATVFDGLFITKEDFPFWYNENLKRVLFRKILYDLKLVDAYPEKISSEGKGMRVVLPSRGKSSFITTPIQIRLFLEKLSMNIF